jgi:hypothetical protein
MHGREKHTSRPEGRLVLMMVVRAKARTYPSGSFSAASSVREAGFQTREKLHLAMTDFSYGENAESRDLNYSRMSHGSDVLYQGTASAVPHQATPMRALAPGLFLASLKTPLVLLT